MCGRAKICGAVRGKATKTPNSAAVGRNSRSRKRVSKPNAVAAAAEATATMVHARAGRSSYVSAAKLAGISDPGAEAVALLFAALAETDRTR